MDHKGWTAQAYASGNGHVNITELLDRYVTH